MENDTSLRTLAERSRGVFLENRFFQHNQIYQSRKNCCNWRDLEIVFTVLIKFFQYAIATIENNLLWENMTLLILRIQFFYYFINLPLPRKSHVIWILLIIFDIRLIITKNTPLNHRTQKSHLHPLYNIQRSNSSQNYTHKSLTTQNSNSQPITFAHAKYIFHSCAYLIFPIVLQHHNDRNAFIMTATIKSLHRRQRHNHGRRDANLVRVLEKQQFRASDMAKTIRRGLRTIFDRLLSSDLRGSVTRPTFSLSDRSEAEGVLLHMMVIIQRPIFRFIIEIFKFYLSLFKLWKLKARKIKFI